MNEAARTCGASIVESHHERESVAEFAARLGDLNVERVRVVGEAVDLTMHAAANAAHVHLATAPVVVAGRIELLHYLREQAMARTLHRFGNLTGAPKSTER